MEGIVVSLDDLLTRLTDRRSAGHPVPTVETGEMWSRVRVELLRLDINPLVLVGGGDPVVTGELLDNGNVRFGGPVGSPLSEEALVDCRVERWIPAGR
jgi:hypothetical protein